MWKIKIQGTSAGVLPQGSSWPRSGVVPHGPPISHLRLLLLLQQRVDIRELLLLLLVPLGCLLLPLGCVLHMSG